MALNTKYWHYNDFKVTNLKLTNGEYIVSKVTLVEGYKV